MANRVNTIQQSVEKIIQKVRKEGDRALEFYTKKLDGVFLSARQFLIPRERIQQAYNNVEPSLRAALRLAAERIRSYHLAELKRIAKEWKISLSGIEVGQIVRPIESVGCYVPGGRTSYPSTVLMTTIPAKVAGVKRVVVVSPPRYLSDKLLAACWIAEVNEVYAVGGAQGIAALAFGTATIPKVNKIVGPGNQYVQEAKRQLFGVVGIDTLAGPSEVAIWAEKGSNLTKVLYNLLAQAEHDPNSKAILLTQNQSILQWLSKKIPLKFKKQVEFVFKNKEKEIIDQINALAPEHLLLALPNPRKVLKKIQNAGAIFLGLNSPVALGDYLAGPSHVLPTGKSAAYASGLSVKDFLKWSSIIENKIQSRDKIKKNAQILAQAEKFYYHSLSLL